MAETIARITGTKPRIPIVESHPKHQLAQGILGGMRLYSKIIITLGVLLSLYIEREKGELDNN